MTGIIRKQTGGLLDRSHTLKWVTVEKYWSFIDEKIKKTLENRTESLLKGSLPSKEHSASSVEWVQLQSIRTWLKKKKGSQKIHTVLSVPNNLERKGERERNNVSKRQRRLEAWRPRMWGRGEYWKTQLLVSLLVSLLNIFSIQPDRNPVVSILH